MAAEKPRTCCGRPIRWKLKRYEPRNLPIGDAQSVFVFVATQKTERLNACGEALRGLGGLAVGPQAFSLVKDITAREAIRDAVGDLEEGECVYVIAAGGKGFEIHLIVASQTEGGITVRYNLIRSMMLLVTADYADADPSCAPGVAAIERSDIGERPRRLKEPGGAAVPGWAIRATF